MSVTTPQGPVSKVVAPALTPIVVADGQSPVLAITAPKPDRITGDIAPSRAPDAVFAPTSVPEAPQRARGISFSTRTPGLLKADMPASRSGATWRYAYEGTYGNNNNNPLTKGGDDDGPTFRLAAGMTATNTQTGREYGVQVEGRSYIQDERAYGQQGGAPILTPGEQMRRDTATVRASARQGFALSDRASVEVTARAGVLVDGELGMLPLQEGWHKLTGGGRPASELPRNYVGDGDTKVAGLVGGTALAGYELGRFTVAGGVSAEAAIGSTGVSKAGPMLIGRFATANSRLVVETHASANYQYSNAPGRTSFNGGELHNGVSANVGARIDVAVTRNVSVGLSIDSDPYGAGKGFGPKGPFGEKYNPNTTEGAAHIRIRL